MTERDKIDVENAIKLYKQIIPTQTIKEGKPS